MLEFILQKHNNKKERKTTKGISHSALTHTKNVIIHQNFNSYYFIYFLKNIYIVVYDGKSHKELCLFTYLPTEKKTLNVKQKVYIFKEWRSGEKKLIFMRASDNILVWKLVHYILKSDNGIPTLFNAYCLCQFIQTSKKKKMHEKKTKFDEEKQ